MPSVTAPRFAIRLLSAATLLGLGLAQVPAPLKAAAPRAVAAEHGMVVSAHHLASEAGVAVLRQGGNAVDAAVAVAYALAVTFPEAGNIGGGGFMVIRMADGRQTFLDFRETAPSGATATMFQDKNGKVIPRLSTRGYLSAGIPGTVAGLELARSKYGTRARAPLMAAAIHLARDGFVLDAGDAGMLAEGRDEFVKDAPSAAVFTNHGQPWQPGHRLVQADLARSLQAIATRGPAAFYKGPIATRMVAASKAHGGIFTMKDFASYRVREMKPLECDYRGWHVVSAPPPSSGGTVICQSLNILEGYPLGELGFHSAQGIHYTTEALRRAFHDRNLQLGDPDFVQADVPHLIAKDYAAALRAGISADKATPSMSLGGIGPGHEGPSTTHFSVVDAKGNAVSLTYTLNDWFGAYATPPGTGILLNDEMDDFTAKPGEPNMYGLIEGSNNVVRPGARPLSSMTPTIVTRDGQLAMVLGTPGGSHIPTGVLQVMLNLIDYRMELQEAVNAPRIHAQWLPDVIYHEHDSLSADTRAALVAKGHKLEEMPYWNQVAAIMVGTPKVGGKPYGKARLYGAIDPRLPMGDALGY